MPGSAGLLPPLLPSPSACRQAVTRPVMWEAWQRPSTRTLICLFRLNSVVSCGLGSFQPWDRVLPWERVGLGSENRILLLGGILETE